MQLMSKAAVIYFSAKDRKKHLRWLFSGYLLCHQNCVLQMSFVDEVSDASIYNSHALWEPFMKKT
jgi:hypothetical protein